MCVRSVRGLGIRGSGGHLLIYISPTVLWGALWDDSLHMHEVLVCVCVLENVFHYSCLQKCTDAINGVIDCTCHSHSICSPPIMLQASLKSQPEVVWQNMKKYEISIDGQNTEIE